MVHVIDPSMPRMFFFFFFLKIYLYIGTVLCEHQPGMHANYSDSSSRQFEIFFMPATLKKIHGAYCLFIYLFAHHTLPCVQAVSESI